MCSITIPGLFWWPELKSDVNACFTRCHWIIRVFENMLIIIYILMLTFGQVETLLEIWREYHADSSEVAKKSVLPEPPDARDRLKQEICFLVRSIQEKAEENGRYVWTCPLWCDCHPSQKSNIAQLHHLVGLWFCLPEARSLSYQGTTVKFWTMHWIKQVSVTSTMGRCIQYLC